MSGGEVKKRPQGQKGSPLKGQKETKEGVVQGQPSRKKRNNTKGKNTPAQTGTKKKKQGTRKNYTQQGHE